MKLSEEQEIQETQYLFPYHYIGRIMKHRLIPYSNKIEFLISTIKNLKPFSVADIGCGDGFLLSVLKNLIPKVIGFDYSKHAISFAKAFNPGTEFKVLNICKKSSSAKFDLITAIEILEHIEQDKVLPAIRNIHKSLKNDGCFMITVPSVLTPVSSKHYQHFSPRSINNHLKGLFRTQKIIGLEKKSTWLSGFFYLTLFLANLLFPLNFTRLSSVYLWSVNLAKNFHKKHLLVSPIKNAKTLLFVCKKINS